MRLSSASSPSALNRNGKLSGSRLRKKHKRLDAICEEEYNRNHSDLVGDLTGVGTASADSELRRSSRIRRAPVLLDVSPPPPKKRQKIHRNAGLSVSNGAKKSPHVSEESKDVETSGSWRSRLRSRSGSAGSRGKDESASKGRKRKLFEEVIDVEEEVKVVEKRANEKKDELEPGKSRTVKSGRLGRVKEATGSKENDKENKLIVSIDDDDCEEVLVIENEEKDGKCESEREEATVTRSKDEAVSMPLESGLAVANDSERTVHDNLHEVAEQCGDQKSNSLLSEVASIDNSNEQLVGIVETGEQGEKHVEEIEATKEAENQADDKIGGVSTEVVTVDGRDSDAAKLSEKLLEPEDVAKVVKFTHASGRTPEKIPIREGRRCGLCGGGTDGKPPKKLVQDMGESDNEVYSGSSASEEYNYDIWDGFGDEPGWLGRLLGPINDRHGIAGIWVHQNCAVWSPEVYFAGLGCLKNVRAALCRGKALKCTRCGRPGATIGCRVDRCPKTYHLPCARANGCTFDHRKFLIACTDHRHIFQPHGIQYLAWVKKLKAKKMKLEMRKLSNDVLRRDIEAEETWLENCGEDEEFLKREGKRLHRDLARIAPVYIGGSETEGRKLFQGWDSVAGLKDVIRCMKEVVILPLLYPEFFDSLGITPPRGVLLHGYPGTGKTLVVRALIGSCARGDKRIAYFARKGADCLGKYVGDAERQLRLLFQVAEKCQPSIIFFDEIDGLAPCRSRQQDQTHNSVVSTLLALLDGLKSRGSVVVIGATNRPDAVDPALRRPGRFDREIYFPLPSVEDRAAIVSLHTERWPKPIAGPLLQWIASRTAGFAGADLQALCTQAAIIALKRNFPLQEILSNAEKTASNGSRPPLPDFAVEEGDWLEALLCAPPPCSRREAGMAANDVATSPLPLHLLPCLLQPLSTLLVCLYIEERVWLPDMIVKAATMIKSVMVSALEKQKIPADHWWFHLDNFLREADVVKEVQQKLTSSGILQGDVVFAGSDHCDHDTREYSSIFEHTAAHNDLPRTNLVKQMVFSSRKKSGFRILIAGNPRSGQRHLVSCLLHCFVGKIEIRKVDLATISQEGHGDITQGITEILMKSVSVGSCVLFMPRIDLWAVETHQEVSEESSLCLEHSPGREGCCTTLDEITESSDECGSKFCKASKEAIFQETNRTSSEAWSLFVEHVESLSLSTSLMILATSNIPIHLLPSKVRQFFGRDVSICSQSTPVEHTVPRFSVQTGVSFNSDMVINLSAAEISRDLVQLVVQLMHEKSHANVASCKGDVASNTVEECAEIVDHSTETRSANENEDSIRNPNRSSISENSPVESNRSLKVKSSLLVAISTFGYQILRYPHFAELCWVTSKLKEGPSADISGPWKGWPFNSCVTRPTGSLEKAGAGGSSNAKTKEKYSLVRGLVAVGLSAYRGLYTSLREVSSEVRKVLDLLVEQINARVHAGKDRYQYIRVLSQVAYLEDMVNSWAYMLQSLEKDSPRIMSNQEQSELGAADNNCSANNNQALSEGRNPNISSDLDGSRLASTEEKEQADLIKSDKDLGTLYANGETDVAECYREKDVLANAASDEPHVNSEAADVLPADVERTRTSSVPDELNCIGNHSTADVNSETLQFPNGTVMRNSAVTSDDGPGGSGESPVGEHGQGVSSIESDSKFSGNAPAAIDEPGVEASHSSRKSKTSAPSETICSMQCCSDCFTVFHDLVRKILVRELGLIGDDWTAEDVHDVVASLSVNLIAAVRKAFSTQDTSGCLDEIGRQGSSERSRHPDMRTCDCRSLGNTVAVPKECTCHSTMSGPGASTSSQHSEQTVDSGFIFREGVLVNVDPDKSAPFHCKLETLCLCSLIELIVMMKNPFD